MEEKVLKLYHVKIPAMLIHLDYNSYFEFVVAAYSDEEARKFHPGSRVTEEGSFTSEDWIQKEYIPQLEVRFLGIAEKDVTHGIICSSYESG